MSKDTVAISVGPHHTMRARWLQPATPHPHKAGIIAIHDIFGYTDDIRRIAERLQANGYPVLVPDLYDLPASKPMCVVKTLKAHETGKGDAFAQLEACRQWLLTQTDQTVEQVGIMGFCMGGRFALLYSAQAPVQVVAPFYGGVPKNAEALQGICPVVGGWGKKDRIYGHHGERLAKHLDVLNVEHDVKTYPETGHSYMNNHQTFVFKRLGKANPMHAAYHEPSAEDSWRRVLAFFETIFSRHNAA